MWIILSFLVAVFTAVQDIIAKRSLKNVSPYVMAWGWMFFSIPFLAIFYIFEGPTTIGPKFIPSVLASGAGLTISAIVYFKAMQRADLSLVMPIVSFTPLFLLVTSPLMMGAQEFPSAGGVLGVLLIVSGSYLLFYDARKKNILAPFLALVSTKGSRYMLLAAFIFSIGGNIDKVGVLHSSPMFYILWLNIAVAFLMGVWMFYKVPQAILQIRENFWGLLAVGFAFSLAMVCQMHALKMTIVPYVIAIKRTSVVMASLWGLYYLKEAGGHQRLIAAFIMACGVMAIAFL